MRLQDADLLQFVPDFMRRDEAVLAITEGLNPILHAMAAKAETLSRWDQIDQMKETELDDLAKDLRVKWYDSTALLDVKRDLIKHSDAMYSKLGTPWAVEQMVQDYFGSGIMREWFEYAGEPHHFKIVSSNPGITNENINGFLAMLEMVKRKSSVLDAILISLTGEFPLYVGAIVRECDHERHVTQAGGLHLYHGAFVREQSCERHRVQAEGLHLYHGAAVYEQTKETRIVQGG